MTDRLDTYITYLESLTPETLPSLDQYVTNDVRFCDPFNDVRGVALMTRVFEEMFENVGPVAFTVTKRAELGDQAFIAWRFDGRLFDKPWTFEGVSELTFAADGRVVEHIDRWDSAGDFWQRVPLIGWLLRRMKRRLQVH